MTKTEIFIKKAKLIHGDRYIYTKTHYINATSPVVIQCKHGDFLQSPTQHLRGRGCKQCGFEKHSLSTDEFIKLAKEKHGNFFDYSKTNYVNSYTPVTIICPTHGDFLMIPNNHLRYNCQKCYHETLKYNAEDFLRLANEKHGEHYDYSCVIYNNSRQKIKIICPDHGPFYQQPRLHLAGQQCRTCVRTLTTEQFIQKANIIHNDRYDYSCSVYNSARSKINIKCHIHGIFEQNASSHLCGVGCPACHGNISRGETTWLDSIGVTVRNKVLTMICGRKFKVDGYNPDTKTIYEFNGDYWHGNPKYFDPGDIHPKRKITFGELYQQTLLKKQILEENGYKVVSIWESEFNSSPID